MKKDVKKTYTKPAMQVKKSVAVVSGSGSTSCSCGYYVSRTCGRTYYH